MTTPQRPNEARPKPPADARSVATRVLFRIATDEAWATPTLDVEIRRAGLDRRDAALASTIVYGALRVLPSLDAVVDQHVHKKKSKLDPYARAAFRAASFQILHLERVPAHAAVNAAVDLVRRERGRQLSGMLNAILRKVAKVRPQEPRLPERLEVPAWVRAELDCSLGAERAAAFLEHRRLPPPTDLRVVSGRSSRAEVMAAVAEARPEAEVVEGGLSPATIRVLGGGDPRALPGFEEGLFTVQEQGSQLIGLLADARPGERVADACAGRGGKTAQLAESVGAEGRIVAIDLYESRLEQIPDLMKRLALSPALTLEPVDLSVGTGGLEGQFDRVLVDAPCTGLGTIHRRPELLLRLKPEDIDRMARLQEAILGNASRLLVPGGRLLYSVCSPTSAEGAKVAASAADFGLREVREEDAWDTKDIPVDPDGCVRIGPWLGGAKVATDAYQIFRWIKV